MPQKLTRAQFTKIALGGTVAAAGAYIVYEWAPWLNTSQTAAEPRQPFQFDIPGVPPIRELIRYATLAASGHNTQPWSFRVDQQSIQLHPDYTRSLKAVDPQDRELWVSLGCALENLVTAARKTGFESEIIYPEKNDFIQIHFSSTLPYRSPHFDAIPVRQNTRSEYDGTKVQQNVVTDLMSMPLEQGISLHLFESQKDMETVLEYVSTGNLHQFNDKAFIDELNHWVRFSKREAIASRDGLSSLCTGNPQIPRWIGQQVLRHMAPQTQADSDSKKLRSSSGLVAIASSSDSKATLVRTGQVYQRLALTMTTKNIKSAFLNQPIEVPEIRDQFRSVGKFGDAMPQLLLRFGYANPMPMSMRRPVDEVILWT